MHRHNQSFQPTYFPPLRYGKYAAEARRWAAGHVLAGWESIGAKFEVMAAGDPVLDAPTS